MKKPIYADDLMAWSETVPLTPDGGIDFNDFEDKLKSMPTIDAVPLSAVRKAAKKLAYIHQRIDLYGDRPDLHEEEYWLEYLMDEEWEDPDIE